MREIRTYVADCSFWNDAYFMFLMHYDVFHLSIHGETSRLRFPCLAEEGKRLINRKKFVVFHQSEKGKDPQFVWHLAFQWHNQPNSHVCLYEQWITCLSLFYFCNFHFACFVYLKSQFFSLIDFADIIYAREFFS